jgi:hypothetical protein
MQSLRSRTTAAVLAPTGVMAPGRGSPSWTFCAKPAVFATLMRCFETPDRCILLLVAEHPLSQTRPAAVWRAWH